MGQIDKRLAELGITLPVAAKPVANYVPWVRTGNLVFISGQGPIEDGKVSYPGCLGERRLARGRRQVRPALRHQRPGPAEGCLRRRPRPREAHREARRLRQCHALLHGPSQGHQRRLRPDGRGVRRQGPPRPLGRRLAVTSVGHLDRGRGHHRSGVSMDRMPTPRALDFLTARPIAHRGLHDFSKGMVENTASAFAAAIARGYAIECDLQLTRDGEAVVFHDEHLDRLTEGQGLVKDLTAAEMKQLAIRNSTDQRADAGRAAGTGEGPGAARHRAQVALGWRRAAGQRARSTVLKDYRGPYCLMSFDPDVIAAVRRLSPAHHPRHRGGPGHSIPITTPCPWRSRWSCAPSRILPRTQARFRVVLLRGTALGADHRLPRRRACRSSPGRSARPSRPQWRCAAPTRSPSKASSPEMLKAVTSALSIARADWDRLANPQGAEFNPLVSHDFFRCLEESGCAVAKTGWAPRHLVMEDDGRDHRHRALLPQAPLLGRICLRPWLGRCL